MKKRVMFLCAGNSCRSQMAEGLLRHLAGDRLDVFSAGTNPSKINATAIRVMGELGIDMTEQYSKSINDLTDQFFDYIITVCDSAKESCPVFHNKGTLMHWPFPDPPHDKDVTDEIVEEFRRVRDLIQAKLRDALAGGEL